MAKITVKGHEFEAPVIRDSFSRRAIQFQNNIIKTLGRLGLTEDDIDIKLNPNVIKKEPASVSWYFDGKHQHYSYGLSNKYVENLAIVLKVVDLEVTALIEERITVEEFVQEFSEDTDVAKKRIEARAVLGLDHDTTDLAVINKAFKNLAKEHHPDTDTGDLEKFKEINQAHKIIKRELR